ncbi:hypothetical protein CPB84DRAFT_1752257 [Gymnopilus junonius]|uniref:Uncharacterized protein n=1 Tax=Gymnopilus junonius TaxID=109634 RepID=A0A9P5TG79_GYMJU|nr:hypothetical protein CPB84DRAFT_1752257 [Gymnopilus junonius]
MRLEKALLKREEPMRSNLNLGLASSSEQLVYSLSISDNLGHSERTIRSKARSPREAGPKREVRKTELPAIFNFKSYLGTVATPFSYIPIGRQIEYYIPLSGASGFPAVTGINRTNRPLINVLNRTFNRFILFSPTENIAVWRKVVARGRNGRGSNVYWYNGNTAK